MQTEGAESPHVSRTGAGYRLQGSEAGKQHQAFSHLLMPPSPRQPWPEALFVGRPSICPSGKPRGDLFKYGTYIDWMNTLDFGGQRSLWPHKTSTEQITFIATIITTLWHPTSSTLTLNYDSRLVWIHQKDFLTVWKPSGRVDPGLAEWSGLWSRRDFTSLILVKSKSVDHMRQVWKNQHVLVAKRLNRSIVNESQNNVWPSERISVKHTESL